MSKKMSFLTPLVTVAAVSVVVDLAIQRLPCRVRADSPSRGTILRSATGILGATAAQRQAAEIQGLGPQGIQAKIHASDEEWKVIGPKLRRVMAAYAAAEASIGEPSISDANGQPESIQWGPGGPGGPGGPPGGPGNDSFAGPGESRPFGRRGPGPDGLRPSDPNDPGGFGQAGPRPSAPPGFGGFPPVGGPPRFGGPPPQGGPPGFGGPGNTVMQKLVELRTALADPNATSEQLKQKITSVREARRRAEAELAAARKDLLELLTPDQEAVLVSLDCLD